MTNPLLNNPDKIQTIDSPPSNSPQQSLLYSLWKFSRPHTIIGTSLSVFGLYILTQFTFRSATFQPELLNLLATWIACLCGNIYIVGLNQLEDIEIDKINKPHLPIAAGEFTPKQAQIIVILTGILSLLIAANTGPFLLAMVSISLALGTAYSLPPIRLKRYPFWASFCIFTVRGIIVNLGLYLHFNCLLKAAHLGNSQQKFDLIALNQIPPQIWLLTLFILIFTFAIAIFKDIPDIEGDRQYNISTFTLKLGAPTIFKLARWVITTCYLTISLAAIFYLPQQTALFLSISHLLTLILLWWRSQKVNLQDKTEIAQFYQFIWKLFFLEYLLFPAACILG
ncbi:homogentisate phytyltransferase [Ancylothrix sp. C2]|uniref:homogentisate phytyltransferase n=1 Tax=Ancylothrix sp. D3o TaxID=2953691 RepID=UPI0021BB3A5E|nr:homogentisate phytyltransferase [Ancylothrix sp. D3o]MCT7948646.1 homogentisate phytyltransferase [Ancylothrix sp. D3o]